MVDQSHLSRSTVTEINYVKRTEMANTVVNRIVKSAIGSVNVEVKRKPYRVAEIENIFTQTIKRETGIKLLMLSTADGIAIAEQSRLESDKRRVAAMANSFLTLGETLTRELSFNSTEYVAINALNGQIVLVRIPAKKPLTLTAAANVDLNIANLLFHTKACAKRILEVTEA